MRTNKHCPKYREDSEAHVEIMDLEKTSIPPDRLGQPQPKTVKKLISKGATKIAVIEAPEDDNRSTSKAKTLKVKCGTSTDNRISDRHLPPTPSVNSRENSEPVTNNKPVKVNKITFSKKTEYESSSQVESHKPAVVIKPPGPSSSDKEQSRKKIIIRQPKEVFNADQVSQEGSSGFEYNRKIKKIVELPHNEQERKNSIELATLRKMREDERWWEEREREREREERNRRLYEQKRILEEQEKLDELRRYQEDIRREWEEEEREKAKKKKKKKKLEVRDDYMDDLPPRMFHNDRVLPERDRSSKRRSVVELGRYGADYAPPAKRRRGGEVGLSNILENVVDTLRARTEVSYLFLKPVTKKEAPDYLDIIDRPMNLSTIREKVKNLGYKNRQEFRHDVWQITYNAHKYNDGRNPGIPPLADQLLELCDYLLDENDATLAEAEASIEFTD